MLIRKILRGFLCFSALALLISISTLEAAVLTGVDPVRFTVGSGSDVSYLLIDESTLSSAPLLFAYRYTYDSNTPIKGYELLQLVDNLTADLDFTMTYHIEYGHALESISYGTSSVGSEQREDLSGTYWSHFLNGGLDNGQPPTSSDDWNYALNGMDLRTLSPGSMDAWTMSYYDEAYTTFKSFPSVTPTSIPEPKSLLIVCMGIVCCLAFHFRKYRQNVQ
jgi:hypothetical protein